MTTIFWQYLSNYLLSVVFVDTSIKSMCVFSKIQINTTAININIIYNETEAIHYNIQFLHRRIISSWYQISLVSDANCSCSSPHLVSCLFLHLTTSLDMIYLERRWAKHFYLNYLSNFTQEKLRGYCIINQKQGSILRQQLILLQHSIELHYTNNRLKRWLEDRLNYPFPPAICNIYSR